MKLKLSNTDYFFIFSVLFLYIFINIYTIQEPLSKRKKRKLKKREKKGILTPEQQAKLDSHRSRNQAKRDRKAEKKRRKEEKKEESKEELRQKALAELRELEKKGELDDLYAEADTRAYKRIYEYRRKNDNKDIKNRLDFLNKLYPHTTVNMNYKNPPSNSIKNWSEVQNYNQKQEEERIKKKSSYDTSRDWEYSTVDNQQRQINFYPYSQKMSGPITIDGVETTTYNDRLRSDDDAELVDVTISKNIANRPLDKSIWQEVAGLFPTDLRSWEKEEPGAFDPDLYLSRKEKRKKRRIEKKEAKKEKKANIKEKKEKKKSGKKKKKGEEETDDNSFFKFFEDLLKNIPSLT